MVWSGTKPSANGPVQSPLVLKRKKNRHDRHGPPRKPSANGPVEIREFKLNHPQTGRCPPRATTEICTWTGGVPAEGGARRDGVRPQMRGSRNQVREKKKQNWGGSRESLDQTLPRVKELDTRVLFKKKPPANVRVPRI